MKGKEEVWKAGTGISRLAQQLFQRAEKVQMGKMPTTSFMNPSQQKCKNQTDSLITADSWGLRVCPEKFSPSGKEIF
ncbi:MAG: hypothetical protein DWQ01_13065 [Planctomycetota bacterium]|nr:MAG: hypothetical protein DWQ01_13065 [Planctomycetota bacterium]